MNKYLKSASERYLKLTKKKEYLINPFSFVDAEIIIEIVELFKKLGANDIAYILKDYKYKKDQEILEQLQQSILNFSNDESGEIENESERLLKQIKKLEEALNRKIQFIEIGNEKLKVDYIYHYRVKYSSDKFGNFLGLIIFNPADIEVSKVSIYANLTFKYYDEDKFEEAQIKLYDDLKSANVEFIKTK